MRKKLEPPLRDGQQAEAWGRCRRCRGELYGEERGLCRECRRYLESREGLLEYMVRRPEELLAFLEEERSSGCLEPFFRAFGAWAGEERS